MCKNTHNVGNKSGTPDDNGPLKRFLGSIQVLHDMIHEKKSCWGGPAYICWLAVIMIVIMTIVIITLLMYSESRITIMPFFSLVTRNGTMSWSWVVVCVTAIAALALPCGLAYKAWIDYKRYSMKYRYETERHYIDKVADKLSLLDFASVATPQFQICESNIVVVDGIPMLQPSNRNTSDQKHANNEPPNPSNEKPRNEPHGTNQ